MPNELWYQTQLESGKIGQVCWVNRRLKKGQIVTLVGDSKKWIVIEQYATSGKPGRRRWNVGGIQPEVQSDVQSEVPGGSR